MPNSLSVGNLEQRIASLLLAEEPLVLISLIQQEGIHPLEVGARVLLTRYGLEGSLDSGNIEELVLQEAHQCLQSGLSRVLHYDSAPPHATAPAPMTFLCEYLLPEQAGMFELAAQAIAESLRAIWLVDIRNESAPHRALCVDQLPFAYQQPEEQLSLHEPEEALAIPLGVSTDYATGKSYLERRKGKAGLLAPDIPLYIEPLYVPPVVLLCGGGLMAQETAELASSVGFLVDVVDETSEYANVQRFPSARQCYTLPYFDQLVQTCHVGRQHYVVIMTRDQEYDLDILAQALSSHAYYIGMLGTKDKKENLCAQLRQEGVPDAELACIRCPIGLPIGAESARQMALAIVAELLAARSGTLPRFRTEE